MDERPACAAPDDDPYLWLEAVDGAAAVVWAEAQSAATLQRFADARFAADRDALTAILDRPDNIPIITRRGGFVYNFWRDAEQPRGLWRRTTLAAYRRAEPAWQVVLDLDALAKTEQEDWIWGGAVVRPGAHDRAMLRLSRGGSDAATFREFDLRTLGFVADGFALPEAKGGLAWVDRDALLLSSAAGEGMVTRSGYPRTVRLWRRGTDPRLAAVLFACEPDDTQVWGAVDEDRGAGHPFVLSRWRDFFHVECWVGGEGGPALRMDLPTDGRFRWHRGWLAVQPRTDWTVGSVTHPAGALIGMSLSTFLAGERDFTTLFTPGPRRALQSFFWTGGRLVVSVLDELRPSVGVFTPGTEGWTCQALPRTSQIGTMQAWGLDDDDAESDGTFLAVTQDPLTPPTLLLADAAMPVPQVLKSAPAVFDPSGLMVTQHEAISEDGTPVPYVQVGPAGQTGDAPLHMLGYGGFGVSELPLYRRGIGKLWLERGGTSVVANLRGGGEFGPAWHDAGRREGKALSHADFAAVAADLVARGVTRPARIAAEGGSNGGLLIANMLTRYPERFGALFCTIPLIDMRRYTKMLAGASWIAEYGDPDNPADWTFLQTISAYHNVATGRSYPPILLATTRRDDRVHPGHARKMAAKLQAMGYQAHYFELAGGGHSYGRSNAEQAMFAALGYAFLRQAIRWEE